jgi:hypothetical protein
MFTAVVRRPVRAITPESITSQIETTDIRACCCNKLPFKVLRASFFKNSRCCYFNRDFSSCNSKDPASIVMRVGWRCESRYICPTGCLGKDKHDCTPISIRSLFPSVFVSASSASSAVKIFALLPTEISSGERGNSSAGPSV